MYELVKYIDEHNYLYNADLAFELACANNHMNTVKYLIYRSHNKDAMAMAAMNGHINIVRYLHNFFYDYDVDRAINWAMRNNHLEIVDFLLKN